MPAESDHASSTGGREGSEPLRVLLAGGGTAGHVNPLLATAQALATRYPGAELSVLGTATGLESTLVPAAGLPLHTIERVPVPRRPSLEFFGLPGRLRSAVRRTGEIIECSRADVVVGYGGYVAAPAYLAARTLKVPVVVHEQNVRPGLANRLGARWAEAVAVSFPGTPLGGAVFTGLPLRAGIADLAGDRALPERARARRVDAAVRLGLDPERVTLVVTGGSSGAQRLNQSLTAAAPDLLAAGVQVLHLTGAGKDAGVRADLDAAGIDTGGGSVAAEAGYRVLAYLEEMADAYACADLVVCRSGAGTVCELAALGLPAVYVPLPIGNGEQRRNAAGVVEAGGGLLVEDAEFSADVVRGRVRELLADPDLLVQMGRAAATQGQTDAADLLAELVGRVAGVAS